MKNQTWKSVTDAQNGITYIIDKKTRQITSYRNKYGQIFDTKHNLIYDMSF